MIGQLRGTVDHVGKDSLILDVAGVGYLVRVTNGTLAETKVGSPLTLKTHLSVREDALDLYGFSTIDEVVFFGLLIGISGIGPKSALGIMNLGEVGTLRSAIASSDIPYLTRVSGVGKKMAEKIVLELRDKLGGEVGTPILRGDADVLEALESLGYNRQEARDVLKRIPSTLTTTNERLKEALKLLGKG